MDSRNKKKIEEREVFLEFAAAVNLPIDDKTVDNEEEPYPDISCEMEGELCYFELTRISDQDFANDMGFRMNRVAGDCPPSVFSVSSRQAVEEAIVAKGKKVYETDGKRFDLLVFYDGIYFPHIEFSLIREALKELSSIYSSNWGTIWFFHRPKGVILWPEGSGR